MAEGRIGTATTYVALKEAFMPNITLCAFHDRDNMPDDVDEVAWASDKMRGEVFLLLNDYSVDGYG